MIDAVVILAGGRGSRLAPWPAPKVLMPVKGVPIIERLLAHVEAAGVPRAIVCTGYRAEDVHAAIARRPGVLRVAFSDAGSDAAMGMRLFRARDDFDLRGPETTDRNKMCRVLVCYGDELADVDLAALARHHEAAGRMMTFTACRQRVPFGVVRANGTPRINDNEVVLANIGFVLIEPGCWELLHADDGLSDWVNRLAALHHASCYLHEGKRAYVNDLADLRRAEEVWA